MNQYGLCRCGCNQKATKYARLIAESDEGTCSALHWAWDSIRTMREWVPVVEGHDEDGLPGYLSTEYVQEKMAEQIGGAA